MDQCLDYGMVGSIDMISNGKRAFSFTKEGMVSIRGNNPTLKKRFSKLEKILIFNRKTYNFFTLTFSESYNYISWFYPIYVLKINHFNIPFVIYVFFDKRKF